jgi:hypothetical protein
VSNSRPLEDGSKAPEWQRLRNAGHFGAFSRDNSSLGMRQRVDAMECVVLGWEPKNHGSGGVVVCVTGTIRQCQFGPKCSPRHRNPPLNDACRPTISELRSLA